MKTEIIENYKNYGKVLSVSEGDTTLYITLDIGPRIIGFFYKGSENLFFEDVERNTLQGTKEMEEHYGPGRHWYLYGGYRLWVSPEIMPYTYYPDNDPVEYKTEGSSVTLTPPPQKENGLAMRIKVSFTEGGILVENEIKNISDEEKRCAAWGLSVMAKGGIALVPTRTDDTGFLANRLYAIWPYDDIKDERFILDDRFVALKQTDKDRAFKVGVNNKGGRVLYFKDGVLVTKQYNVTDEEYPDWGCSAELYTCRDFLEAESLSPLTCLKPGETLLHTELWTPESCPTPAFDTASLAKFVG